MTDFRAVRSLIRGLEILEALNRRNGSTVTEVAQETGLSRGTVYRMLETLREGGYVYRDESDGRYRLTILVKGLSDGFSDETWVSQIAKPMLEALGKEVVWPLGLATRYGSQLILRETTDQNSPLALRRYGGGFHVPMMNTAAGKVYLAYCDPEQRETLLDILSRSDSHPANQLARNTKMVTKMLEEVRAVGYATAHRPDLKQVSFAVPVFSAGKIFATITLRYIDSALTVAEAIQRYLGPVQKTANAIGDAVAKRNEDAR